MPAIAAILKICTIKKRACCFIASTGANVPIRATNQAVLTVNKSRTTLNKRIWHQ